MAKAKKLRKFRFVVRTAGGNSEFVTQEAFKQVEAIELISVVYPECEIKPL